MDSNDLKKRFNISEIVVTSGEKGGYVLTESGEIVKYKANKGDTIIDTTGAGDVFFAAYLSARLYKKQTIEKSSCYASLIASRHVEGKYISENRLRLSYCMNFGFQNHG